MLRRDFIKGSLYAAGYTLVSTSFLRKAQADSGTPYLSLMQMLPPNSAHLVRPNDAQYSAYNVAFNKRTQLAPQLRLLPLTTEAVAAAVNWVRENNVAFAIRCGGHSYEGFSQSSSFVIDLRLMNSVEVDAARERAVVGGGAALGQVYRALGNVNRAIAAGSCPTVGIGGHSTGGGFGFLTRAFGLACDQIESFEIVTADGRVLTASANENVDLFWACRGGGGGSFGIITSFTFITHSVSELAVFGMGWTLPAASAAKVLSVWEEWAPNTSNDVSSVMRANRDRSGQIALRCTGQSLGGLSRLRTQIGDLLKAHPSAALQAESKDFNGATNHFAGTRKYTTGFMAGKSDYVKSPMGTAGFSELCKQLQSLPTGSAVVMMDSYGGAVKELAPDATAFAHRDALFGMQYASYWSDASENSARMQGLAKIQQAMRPHVSGSAYVNYPDADLKDYKTAYWGNNLSRLEKIKAQIDPTNLFHHKQSI